MIILLSLVIIGYLTWRNPIFGILFYFLANTGVSGFLKMYHISDNLMILKIDNPSLILFFALYLILIRHRENNYSRWRYNLISLLLSLISISFAINFIYNARYLNSNYGSILNIFWWFPLYIGYIRLPYNKRDQIESAIVFSAIITGLLSIYIVLFHNLYLLNLLGTLTSPEEGTSNLIASRIIVNGVWSVIPTAYWFCLSKAFDTHDKYNIYTFGLFVMAFATILTVTRNTTATMIGGTLFTYILVLVYSSAYNRMRVIITIFVLFLLCVLLLVFNPSNLIGPWLYRINGKNGELFHSSDMRIIRDDWMLRRLMRSNAIFHGMNNPDSGWEETRASADGFIMMWWEDGLMCSIALLLVRIIVTYKLIRLLFKSGNTTRQNIGAISSKISYIISLNVYMFSGFMYTPISIVLLVISLAWCTTDNKKYLMHNNYILDKSN